MIEQIGTELRQRRAALGMSREDVYKKFRLPLGFIVAIETGQTDRLPALIYTRSFLKSYCESLGLRPEPHLDLLEESLRKPHHFFARRTGGDGNAPPRPKWIDDALMWAAVLGIVAMGWLTYSVIFQPGAPDHTRHVQAETVNLRMPDPFAAP